MAQNKGMLRGLEISPDLVKGIKGFFHIKVNNTGTQNATYDFKADDTGGQCNYEFNISEITVSPGGSAEVLLTASFKTNRPNQLCIFTVHKADQFGHQDSIQARLQSKAGVPAWAPIAGIVALVVVVAVAIAMAGGGSDSDKPASGNVTNPVSTSTPTQAPATSNAATTTPATTTTSPPTTTVVTPPLNLVSSTLSMGLINQAYSSEIVPTGGKTPYTFTSAGALPAGLKITSLNDRCRLEGTPTEYGEFTFSITVKDSVSSSTPVNATFKLVLTPNLNGSWVFSTTITAAGGACSGEVGLMDNETIKIEQTALKVVMSGFVNNPANQMVGDISVPSSSLGGGKWVVIVTGSYSEDGGTTASTRTLTLNSPTSMSGFEDWTWSGPGGSCPGGKANQIVQKVP